MIHLTLMQHLGILMIKIPKKNEDNNCNHVFGKQRPYALV